MLIRDISEPDFSPAFLLPRNVHQSQHPPNRWAKNKTNFVRRKCGIGMEIVETGLEVLGHATREALPQR